MTHNVQESVTPENDPEKEPEGVGGVLVLLAFLVAVAPIRHLFVIVPEWWPIFSDGTWHQITDSTSPAYDPWFGPMIIGEIIINHSITLLLFVSVYFFFKKHRLFPKLYIGIMLFSIFFVLFDAWLVTFLWPETPMFDFETTKEVIRTLIVAAIWVPYLVFSKRVKAVFFKG